MKSRSIYPLVLAALTLVLVTFAARADDASLVRAAADRAEIEALMWRYVRALDTYDEAAYAAVFTEDGQFGAGPNATRGRDALQQMIVGLENASAEREAATECRHHPCTTSSRTTRSSLSMQITLVITPTG